MSPPPPWSELHPELLELIFKKLANKSDIINCHRVCLSWRAAIRLARKYLCPLIIFTRHSKTVEFDKEIVLYDPESGQHSVRKASSMKDIICAGTCHGYWLVGIPVSKPRRQIHLINAISLTQIALPGLIGTRIDDIDPNELRIVSSNDPVDKKCVFFAFRDDTNSVNHDRGSDRDCIVYWFQGARRWYDMYELPRRFTFFDFESYENRNRNTRRREASEKSLKEYCENLQGVSRCLERVINPQGEKSSRIKFDVYRFDPGTLPERVKLLGRGGGKGKEQKAVFLSHVNVQEISLSTCEANGLGREHDVRFVGYYRQPILLKNQNTLELDATLLHTDC